MTKVSREGREYHQGRGERGESPQLKVDSVGERDCGGNRKPQGPGGMLDNYRCKCNWKLERLMLFWRTKASISKDDVAVHIVVQDQEVPNNFYSEFGVLENINFLLRLYCSWFHSSIKHLYESLLVNLLCPLCERSQCRSSD